MNWRSFAVLFVVLMLVFAVIPVRDGVADVGVESIRTLDVAAGGGGKGRPLFVDGEVLVKFNTRASEAEIAGLRASQGAQEVGVSRFSGVRRWRVPASKSVEEFVSLLGRNPLVEYVEPNYVAYSSMVPNDPLYDYQWHFDNPTYGGIKLESAWDLETGDSDVVVVDTGVAYEDNVGLGYWHLDTYNAYGGSGYSWWCGVSSAPSSWSELYGTDCSPPGYGNGWNEYLQHSFDLTAATGSVDFSYRYRCHLENGYDFAYVEISSNDGSDWVELTAYTGSGGPGGVKWRSDSVDLTNYTGSDVLVRFRVNSDDVWSDEDGDFNSDGAFFVDDIVLSDVSGVLFSDDAESGSGEWEISSYEMAPDLGGNAFWINDDEILDMV